MKKVILWCVFALFFSSCAVKVPLSSDYYQNDKKVGILYLIDSIGHYREGAQGILDMAVTGSKKYEEPLQIVDEQLKMKERVRQTYTDVFKSYGKVYAEIEADYDKDNLPKFQKSSISNKDKKYHKYDIRFLKDKGMDELLIVKVKYGLLISYYGMIELQKNGHCTIETEIVDLSDNSIIFKDRSMFSQKLKGKWKKPPKYENLKNVISAAMQRTFNIVKQKMSKPS